MTKIINEAEINFVPIKKLPLTIHIEHFLIKYRILSSCDLAILISHASKSPLPFKKLQSSISVTLNKLKKQRKISKVKPKRWQWNNEMTI